VQLGQGGAESLDLNAQEVKLVGRVLATRSFPGHALRSWGVGWSAGIRARLRSVWFTYYPRCC
jgi:hypothetical protein